MGDLLFHEVPLALRRTGSPSAFYCSPSSKEVIKEKEREQLEGLAVAGVWGLALWRTWRLSHPFPGDLPQYKGHLRNLRAKPRIWRRVF